jgi:K+-sensing histidine kinase KdpD
MSTMQVSAQDTFRADVSTALTLLVGASRALRDRNGSLDEPRAEELIDLIARKSQELYGRLAPVLRKL